MNNSPTDSTRRQRTLKAPVHRRYLVKFNPKRIPHAFTDILVIGGGIAGARAALAIPPSLETTVITKDVLTLSNSAWAQGGIAGVLDPEDQIENHAHDTMAAGKGLCEERIVDQVVAAAPDVIRELVKYGAKFDQTEDGLALTKEGGHSHRRIAHALGDATGREIMRALITELRSRDSVQIWEKTFTIDLLTHEGRCVGALVWNSQHGRTFVWAKQTILATGGAGCLFRETTNPDIATGDGHALAFRAGAQVRDMEMMQFHPTVLYIAGGSRHLISEAVRGEGAYLIDCNGSRFMPEYDEAAELAPRDTVSRAITAQMEKTQHPCVYLDLRHLPETLVRTRFPNIAEACAQFGLDLMQEPIPVRPGAHYMIGGLSVDERGRTSLNGLWAAGEVTSTGLHGANRLASNSLLEGIYFGKRAGEGAADFAIAMPDRFAALPLRDGWDNKEQAKDNLNLKDVRNSLMSLMWRNAGIRRDAENLEAAIRQVNFWDRYVSMRVFDRVEGWELQNMILVARLLLKSALAREESRGVHFRSDFPEPRDEFASHVTVDLEP